jgi:hypothetical protein
MTERWAAISVATCPERVQPDRPSALELLASVPQEICAEALMLPHGFTGFATVTAQRVLNQATALGRAHSGTVWAQGL